MHYRVIPALSEHLPFLPEIEREAAKLFPPSFLPEHLRSVTIPLADLKKAQRKGLLWVAISEANIPLGFAITRNLEESLFIEEMDVSPQFQGLGIGTSLINEICTSAQVLGYKALSLTTYIHIPWNAPWYRKLGFRVLQPAELTEELAEILHSEGQKGLVPSSRVAMVKEFEPDQQWQHTGRRGCFT